MRSSPLPLIAITGFLGSGKSTFLQYALQNSGVPLEKIAVIINDFGAINIDAVLLARPNLAIQNLGGGCVCCTSYQELLDTLLALAQKPELELVWLETSGLAEPEEMLNHLTSPLLENQIRIQQLIQLIDASNFPPSWRHRAVAEEQSSYADWIILNKTDLVSASIKDEIVAKLKTLNPHAFIQTTSHGQIDLSGLKNPAPIKKNSAVSSPTEKDAGASTFFFPLTQPVARPLFEKLLRELPEEIYRAKGFIRLQGEERAFTFQYVRHQGELLLLPLEVPPAALGLVFIGPHLDETRLKEHLQPLAPSKSSGTRLPMIP